MTPELFVAPLQGFSDTPFCHFHSVIYGGADAYFTPFIRMEKGAVRMRDLRNITSPLCGGFRLIPQIIFRDIDEFRSLCTAVRDAGYHEMDINMGCPFPPQVRHGRGAALLRNRTLLEAVKSEIPADMSVSVKMRLGLERPDEWRDVADVLNAMPLSRITVHPRVAAQQYTGQLYMDEFARCAAELRHPLVFNGDITTPQRMDEIAHEYPGIAGYMAGRGVLSRPSLFTEWRDGQEWSRQERIQKILLFHGDLYRHYSDVLCGPAQILMKVKPFWEYLEDEIGRKAFKAIKKASSLSKYEEAIRMID